MAVREAPESAGGEDSLLDVIANLVGVLIILVAIASIASRKGMEQAAAATDPVAEVDAAAAERAASLETARRVRAGLDDATRELRALQNADEKLQMLRHQALIERELILREIREARESDDPAQPDFAETRLNITRMEKELTRLGERLSARRSTAPEQREIRHYPTPIARTVFSDEVHFRLSGGRLSYVPINELMDQMKAKWKSGAAELQPGRELADEVGPLEGFRMNYRLLARVEALPGGEAQRISVELQQFRMQPQAELFEEPVAVALQDGSRFQSRLARWKPEKTTISVWVYPDSFEAYSQLRDHLRQSGFQTAAWPIENGQTISGGPNGMRTTAQ